MLQVLSISSLYLALVSWFKGSPTINTNGCGAPSPWKFDSTNHSNVTLPDLGRSFYVHIPASYNPTVHHAVVLSFHGFESFDSRQEERSGLSKDGLKIGDKGIISVYPLGAIVPGKRDDWKSHGWQGAPYAKPGVDDIAFVVRILDELKANLCVDQKRIYASGMSNGGGFTNLLDGTPSTASLIAAFAHVSPALYSGTHPIEGCEPGRVVPTIAIHGLKDHIVPFHGRKSKQNETYDLPDIPQFREAWAKRNGCKSITKPTVSHPHELTTVHEWQCDPRNTHAVVKGYSVSGLGHFWPRTDGPEKERAPFDATPDDILPFFSAYTLDGSLATDKADL